MDEDQSRLLNIEDYIELQELPSATEEYYKIENEKGKRFGLFPYIPHLLSIGEVEVNDVEIITWNKFSEAQILMREVSRNFIIRRKKWQF